MTSKGAWNDNLPINPPVQPPSIPKASAKTSIDGIHCNVFLKKFCRDLYTKVYRQRSLVLERKLHLESFFDTPIPSLFGELGWLPLASFTGTAYAPIVRMFYLNIIEHDLDESYLKSSPAWVLETFLTFSIYPPSHQADICKNGYILLTQIFHREPINLTSCILDKIIVRGYPSMSKNEVLPYGILITKIYQRAGVEFPANSSILEPMGPNDTSSWNRS